MKKKILASVMTVAMMLVMALNLCVMNDCDETTLRLSSLKVIPFAQAEITLPTPGETHFFLEFACEGCTTQYGQAGVNIYCDLAWWDSCTTSESMYAGCIYGMC